MKTKETINALDHTNFRTRPTANVEIKNVLDIRKWDLPKGKIRFVRGKDTIVLTFEKEQNKKRVDHEDRQGDHMAYTNSQLFKDTNAAIRWLNDFLSRCKPGITTYDLAVRLGLIKR